MDSKNELNVFHVRSSQGVISAGYRLYMGNFRKLLRRTWPFGVVYALFIALMLRFYLQWMPQYMMIANMVANGKSMAEATATMGQSSAAAQLMSLVYYGVTILFFAPVFAALLEHKQTDAIAPPTKWWGKPDWPMTLRMLKLFLWFLLVIFLGSIAAGLASVVVIIPTVMAIGKTNMTLVTGVVSLMIIVMMLLMLPLAYTAYKYLLTPGSRFLPLLRSTYGVGMRHWGSLFLVGLIVSIVTIIIGAVVLLPYYILIAAMVKAQVGVLGGDPVGMPDYMNWMSTVVFVISGFILGYLTLSSLFPFYYLYGSIEKLEEERSQLINKQKEWK